MSALDSAISTVDAVLATTDTTVNAEVSNVDAEITPLDTPEVAEGKAEGEEQTEGGESKAEGETQDSKEGSEQKSEEQKLAEAASKLSPDSVRKALREWRDSDPEHKNAAIVKALHGAYERWNAAKEVFPTVAEMRTAKEFLQGHGGVEGVTNYIANIDETDKLLYSAGEDIKNADQLWSNIVDDLKNEGKLEALPNIAQSLLANLEQHAGSEAFAEVAVPVIARGLQDSGATRAVNAIWTALNEGKTGEAKELLKGLGNWMSDMLQRGSSEKKAERQLTKLEAAKQEFEVSKQKEFTASIGKEASSSTIKIVGKALAPYLNGAYKAYSSSLGKPALRTLAAALMDKVQTGMVADKAYQTQMKALWARPQENKQKMLDLTAQLVEKLVKDGTLVRNTISEHYPSWLKSGSPAMQRQAARAEREAAQKKADATSKATGKPQYVPSKPAWDSIDWDKDPKQVLYITGKAYLKGSGRFVTWRK